MSDISQFIQGFQRFQQHYFQQAPELFARLKHGQKPSTLLIGCCDSRVEPSLLLGCHPGQLFTIRNVANLVPPCIENDSTHHGVSAAIQFAVETLEVSDIIVLGHRQCGGIHSLFSPASADPKQLDFIRRWMDIATPAYTWVKTTLATAPQEQQQRACEQAALLISLKNLLTFPWVAQRLDRKQLSLHGWYFDLENGALLAYTPHNDDFVPIVCPMFAQAQ